MPEEKKPESRRKFGLHTIIYRDTFLLIFSFCAAIIAWFVMASGDTEANRVVTDVPIEVVYSPAATEEGLRVFKMSYSSADLEISGNSLITNKLTASDFKVSANLNPTSVKLAGNTMQKMVVKVRAEKVSTVSDYGIVTINPEEVTLEYDRYKEVTLPIENQVKYSADAGYASGTVTLSEESVTISGPESSVNKIGHAVVDYQIAEPLRADANTQCQIKLYDQENQELTGTEDLYLEMSIDTVDVNIPVLPKKTVSLVPSAVRRPGGFPDNRITVEPAQIEIAGTAETLAGINEITLDTAIDFADLKANQRNVFKVDIPLPTGVRNLSASAENPVSQATVTVNLNGYRVITASVPAANVQVANCPPGRDVGVNTQFLPVTVIGPEAQVSKLTGDSISIQLDLTNYQDTLGSRQLPVSVSLTGASADSCWVLGQYSVTVTLENAVAAQAEVDSGGDSAASASRAAKLLLEDDAAATPQE